MWVGFLLATLLLAQDPYALKLDVPVRALQQQARWIVSQD